MKPSIAPTERSMLRDTMMSTMPVAMIAIDALWTERFQRLRGVRKVPPDMKLKLIQITASAAIIPSIRVSTSSAWRSDRTERPDGSRGEAASGTVPAWVIVAPPWRGLVWNAPRVAAEPQAQGAFDSAVAG